VIIEQLLRQNVEIERDVAAGGSPLFIGNSFFNPTPPPLITPSDF
jgi:hypothetical protein